MKVNKETREVVKPVVEDVFILELTREEACALMAVVGKIGGNTSSKYNLRKHMSPLYSAMESAGIDWWTDELVKNFANHIVTSMVVG